MIPWNTGMKLNEHSDQTCTTASMYPVTYCYTSAVFGEPSENPSQQITACYLSWPKNVKNFTSIFKQMVKREIKSVSVPCFFRSFPSFHCSCTEGAMSPQNPRCAAQVRTNGMTSSRGLYHTALFGGGLKSAHMIVLVSNMLSENKNRTDLLYEEHKRKYGLRFRPGVSFYILSPFPADLAHSSHQLHMYRNLLPLQSSQCPSSTPMRYCSA